MSQLMVLLYMLGRATASIEEQGCYVFTESISKGQLTSDLLHCRRRRNAAGG